jgi:hypothetical protein
MQQSVLDGAELITRRLYMGMSYHHAQVTPHRKFNIIGKTNSKYQISHTTCINAALAMLRLQAELFEQCKPGRMLRADRWKILSLIQSGFLLATTVLCLNLNDRMEKGLIGKEGAQKSVEALKASRGVWEQQQDFSKEAQTAVKAVSFVLGKLNNDSRIESQEDMLALGGGHASSSSLFYTGMGSNFDPMAYKDISQMEAPYNMQGGFFSTSFGEFFEADQELEGWLQV